MRLLTHPFFVFSCLTYLALKLTRNSAYRIPYFIHDYLSDLLCMPVVLGLALAFMRVVQGDPRKRLNDFQIAAAVVLFAALFEGLFPLFSSRFVADPWDVLAYAAGALAFRWVLNRA